MLESNSSTIGNEQTMDGNVEINLQGKEFDEYFASNGQLSPGPSNLQTGAGMLESNSSTIRNEETMDGSVKISLQGKEFDEYFASDGQLSPGPLNLQTGKLQLKVNARSYLLDGKDVHGFITLSDLHIDTVSNETSDRWLRPVEIHAILTNCDLFVIDKQPLQSPQSGAVALFDRKIVKSFRSDGHKWKRAYDKLIKVGGEHRLRVYYARSEEDIYFVRRCYNLLTGSLKDMVLVHYRQELKKVKRTMNPSSSSTSKQLEPENLTTWKNQSMSLEINTDGWEWDALLTSTGDSSFLGHFETPNAFVEPDNDTNEISTLELDDARLHMDTEAFEEPASDSVAVENHQKILQELNTLEWEELLERGGERKLNDDDDGHTDTKASAEPGSDPLP